MVEFRGLCLSERNTVICLYLGPALSSLSHPRPDTACASPGHGSAQILQVDEADVIPLLAAAARSPVSRSLLSVFCHPSDGSAIATDLPLNSVSEICGELFRSALISFPTINSMCLSQKFIIFH